MTDTETRVRQTLLKDHLLTIQAAANAAAEALAGITASGYTLEMLGYELADSSLQKAEHWARETAYELGRLTP
jgi:hypothetical protein